MEFTSDHARAHYDAVRDVLDGVVVGLDFDGTLSPVVDDPEAARLHPAAPGALLELAEVVRAVAVITGRPARQAIAMGDLDALGNAMLDRGAELFVFGQYGNERWSATEQRIRSPRPPAGLASFERELPSVLRGAGAAEAFVEEKGLAVAVHTRRMEDPAGAFERLV
jgi:trehalose 6-phosphate phosphatase